VETQIVNAASASDGDPELYALRARVDHDPRDLNSRLALADRYQKLGFQEVALEHLRLACERAPESDAAHTALARMLRNAKRGSEALNMLTAYTAANAAAGAGIWGWLGLLRDDAGDWKAGEAAHRKAIALAPDREEFHNNLGYCLLQSGRRPEAAEEFRVALKLHPHSAIAENNLALALAPDAAGKQEAVAHLQSVSDPATAHNNLAAMYLEAGRYAEAHREIETALGYDRTHSAALSNLQLLSELEGRPAELPNAAAGSGANSGGWSRLASVWRRLWETQPKESQSGVGSGMESGKTLATR